MKRLIQLEDSQGQERLYEWPSAEGTYATVRIGRLIKWACVGATVILFAVFGLGWLIWG